VEVPCVVDVVERDGRRDQTSKVLGVRGAQRFGGSEGVDEEGCAAVYAVAYAVEDLVAWWGLEVPAVRGRVMLYFILIN
jgi:hypothetical protein